jgi:Fur family transcriptional regulator, peroxide stress response regulator
MRAIEFTGILLENRRRLAAYVREHISTILKLRTLPSRYAAILPISTLVMPERSPDLADQLRAFEEMCRQSGFPLTVQRRVILECVLQRHDHPTADQVHEEVRARVPEISRTTVYRTLEALVQMGAIRRAHHLGPASRFDSNTHHHHHLVCVRCNSVTDFEDPRLDSLPVPETTRTAFQIMDYSVHYAGLCAACQAADRKGQSNL